MISKDNIKTKLKRAATSRAIRKYGKHQQGVAFSSFIAGAAWAVRLLRKQASLKTLKR